MIKSADFNSHCKTMCLLKVSYRANVQGFISRVLRVEIVNDALVLFSISKISQQKFVILSRTSAITCLQLIFLINILRKELNFTS